MNTTIKPKGKKMMRCCIDLGSSYFKMLSVEAESGPDGIRITDSVQERIYVGWGEDVAASGSIPGKTADRAAGVFENLTGKIAALSDLRLTAVSTNVLRKAANRHDVRKLLEKRTGVEINVLSERGEAFLGFAGATSGLERGASAILFDAGGTSTELAWGSAQEAVSFVSIPYGTHSVRGDERTVSARIEKMLFDEGVPSGDSPLPGTEESPTIMLTGGTAVSLSVVWRQMHGVVYDGMEPVEISVEDLDLLAMRISALFRRGRERRLLLPPERIRLLLPGLAIIRGTARALRAEKMIITTRDLRWGVVLGEGITERGYLADEQESPDSR